MKRFVFDFDLDIWMQDVEIEADDYDKALEELLNMSVKELVENGYIKDYNIKELDCQEYDSFMEEE